jgi:hypothetical protein
MGSNKNKKKTRGGNKTNKSFQAAKIFALQSLPKFFVDSTCNLELKFFGIRSIPVLAPVSHSCCEIDNL